MQFLFPGFLWALGALAIPIVIHLFHFRRFKRVYFTNVHLLQELKEETSSRSRLKSLLVLLSRLLALAALVFAFAQPIIRHGAAIDDTEATIALYIDNSYSMQSDLDDVPLLTIARDRALEIIDAHGDDQQYIILSNELSGKSQRLVDHKTAAQFVTDITASSEVSPLSDIISVAQRVHRRGAPETALDLYMLSDFQENITLSEAPADSTVAIQMMPIRSVRENNVALLSARLEGPVALQNVPNTLLVQLHNYSSADQDIQLRMDYAGRSQPLGIVSIPAESTVMDTVQVSLQSQRWHDITLSIEDYPVAFDNDLYISTVTQDRIRILEIYDRTPDRHLRSAAESITAFDLTQYGRDAIQYDQFAEQDLIILNDLQSISTGLSSELAKYVRAGGNVYISPGANVDIAAYNSLLSPLSIDRLADRQRDSAQQVSTIDTRDFIFSDVYRDVRRNIQLPTTQLRYTLQRTGRSDKTVIMSYRDGAPFLSKYIVDAGQVYLCSAPMSTEYSSLTRQAEIFVPMIYKMALSTATQQPLSHTIGDDEIVVISSTDMDGAEAYRMTGPVEFIPLVQTSQYRTTVDVRDQVSTAGHYRLVQGDTDITHLAYNYDRTESDVSYAGLDEVARRLGSDVTVLDDRALADLSGYIEQRESGTPLWRWCLFGALLFLLVESLLLRYWK